MLFSVKITNMRKMNVEELDIIVTIVHHRVFADDITTTPIDYCRTNVVHPVTRVNLMSGKEYGELSNTPNYCGPSSEAYWSA